MLTLPYTVGRYKLLKKIAQGGMAEIYAAEYRGESGFSKTVAVKRLLPHWSANPGFVKMLQDEAKLVVHLQHQNIAQVFELGRGDDGIFFISMEMVEGFDLRQVTQQVRAVEAGLPPKFSYWIIGEILQALVFAHSRIDVLGKPLGIVHRDLSPQNILIARHGAVKVTDFGIAKGSHRQEETLAGQLKGKFAYMSPEQASGAEVDQRSDIFSLGIVLFELVTGMRLFDAETDPGILEKVRMAQMPTGWERAVAPEIRAILRKSLKKNVEERYQTAEEMHADLERYVRKSQCFASGIEFSQYLRDLFPPQVDRPADDRVTSIELRPPVARWSGLVAATLLFSATGAHALRYTASPLAASPPLAAVARAVAPVLPPAPPIVPARDPDVGAHGSAALPTPSTVPQSSRGYLSVHVRPWGYVTVPGIVARRESPLVNVPVPAGTYHVKVFYEPTQKWISSRVKITPDGHTHCQARFGDRDTILCRP